MTNTPLAWVVRPFYDSSLMKSAYTVSCYGLLAGWECVCVCVCCQSGCCPVLLLADVRREGRAAQVPPAVDHLPALPVRGAPTLAGKVRARSAKCLPGAWSAGRLGTVSLVAGPWHRTGRAMWRVGPRLRCSLDKLGARAPVGRQGGGWFAVGFSRRQGPSSGPALLQRAVPGAWPAGSWPG